MNLQKQHDDLSGIKSRREWAETVAAPFDRRKYTAANGSNDGEYSSKALDNR